MNTSGRFEFADFCAAHGLLLDAVIDDGLWHRCRTTDKPRKRNGSYVFDGRGGACINYATMMDHAKWRAGHEVQVSAQDIRAAKERIRQAEREKAHKQQAAAHEASRILRTAKSVVPRPEQRWKSQEAVYGHPYLIKKGFPQQAYREHEGKLVVPMYDVQGGLVGAQLIDVDGTKKFLPGQRSKGAVMRLGRKLGNGQAWLVEGYATALSVMEALKALYINAEVVVCFSASNLIEVAKCLGTHVFADNDESKAGELAAIATGLPWVMSPQVGEDANDMHTRLGIRSVADLMRSARAAG